CPDSCGYSSSLRRRPRPRTLGCAPALRCRSGARRVTTSIRRSAKSMSIWPPIDPEMRARRICATRLDEDTSAAADESCRADDAQDLGDRGDPLAHLLETVVAQPAHALAHGDLADLLGAAPLEREGLNLGHDLHHLVQADAPAVAAAI